MFNFQEPAPMSEEQLRQSSLEWWKNLDEGISFSDFTDEMKEHTYPFKLIPLSRNMMESMINIGYGDSESGPMTSQEVCDEFQEMYLDAMQHFHSGDLNQPFQKEMFIKLISRSPKDVLADFNNSGKPEPVTSSMQGLNAMLSSMRVIDDLAFLKYIPEKAFMVFRPYVDFEPYMEFRAFVKDGGVIGISQYYYNETFPELELEDTHINKAAFRINKMIREVLVPNIKKTSFVADFVLEYDGLKILELNPYGMSDPCLFRSYAELESNIGYAIRYNKSDNRNLSTPTT